MQTKRAIFGNKGLPYLLLAPQLAVTVIFFLWPAAQAVRQSFLREDAFGMSSTFVGMRNYTRLFDNPEYLNAVKVTVVFSVSTVVLALGVSLVLALAVDRMIRSGRFYTTLLVWPYAVAPAVAGILWWFIFNPTIGIMPYILETVFGYDWNHSLTASDAMILVVIAAAWKQISYNFLFFLAGLQSIPKSLTEAAAIDGAELWVLGGAVGDLDGIGDRVDGDPVPLCRAPHHLLRGVLKWSKINAGWIILRMRS